MNHIRRLAFLLCVCSIIGLFAGCGSSSSKIIRMDIDGPVTNLDPQFSTDATAKMIMANLWEGLLVQGPEGELRLGAASGYQVSEDGLHYTFTLREDARWEDGEPLTAEDFVFAFHRIFNPDAPSPYAKDFGAILASDRVLSRSTALRGLGVRAPDSQTVEFFLSRPSAVFLQQLATTAALPCRESLFLESRGRYGLELQYTFSNGPFQLSRWDNTRYLYLDRNDHYRAGEDALARPDRVTLYIGREDPVGQFLDGKSDLALVPSSAQNRVGASDGQLLNVDKTVWCIVFNQNDPAWKNPLLRQGLAHTVDYGLFAEELASNLVPTQVFVPPAMSVEGESYRGNVGSLSPLGFDPAKGLSLYRMGLSALGLDRLPQTVLYVPETDNHQLYLSLVQQGWQKHLGVHINAEPTAAATLAARLTAGDYQMLLMPFTPGAQGPDVLLTAFSSESTQNHFGYHNLRFDQALADAQSAGETGDAIRLYQYAEDLLLTDVAVLPVYFETTCYALAKELTGVEISPFGGQILFRDAVKGK